MFFFFGPSAMCVSARARTAQIVIAKQKQKEYT